MNGQTWLVALFSVWFSCFACLAQAEESAKAVVARVDKLCATVDAGLNKCIVSERHLYGLGNMSSRCRGWFRDGKLVKAVMNTDEVGLTETVYFDQASAAILIREVAANSGEERAAERLVWYMVNGEAVKKGGESSRQRPDDGSEDPGSEEPPYGDFTVDEYWGHRAELMKDTFSCAPKGGRVVDNWSVADPVKLAEAVFSCLATKNFDGLVPLFSKESASFGIAESSDCDYFSPGKVVGLVKGYVRNTPITWVDKDELIAEAAKKRTPLNLVTHGWKDDEGQVMYMAFEIERRKNGKWELNGVSARYPYEERKQWAAERKSWPLATVKAGAGLALRNQPAENGQESDRIPTGGEVRIREAVTEEVPVNGVKNRWYYVYSEDRADVCGYCFGADLEIKGNPAIKVELYQFPPEETGKP